MTKEKDKKDERPSQESGNIDPAVLDVIQDEKRKGTRRRPKNVSEERKKRKLAEDGLKAIKAKDVRTFSELLLRAGIREGSPEWKNAWKAFYST
jgi:hypothetical protein